VLNESLYSSGKSDWETPADLFLALDQEFHFDMDVCAMPSNAKCDRFFTPEQDALSREWAGVVYMNPPYGRQIKVWISKAHTEAVARSVVSVCLVPVRTDTRWWHDHVMQATEIRLMTRRLTFAGATNKAPFPTAIVIFSASDGLGNPRLRKMIV
jgi:phage N-6-adenine-methyltransferase